MSTPEKQPAPAMPTTAATPPSPGQRRCGSWRANGSPCRRPLRPGEDSCWHHKRRDGPHSPGCSAGHAPGWGVPVEETLLAPDVLLVHVVCAGCSIHSVWIAPDGWSA